MNKQIKRFRIAAIILFIIIFYLIFTSKGASGHNPHDDVYNVSFSAAYKQDKTIFIIVRGNLFKSIDGGTNWQRLVNGIDNHGNLKALIIAPENPQILYLSAVTDGIYKSADGGNSWVKTNNGLENLDIELLATNADGSKVLAAGEDQGLYYSGDGGENWQTAIKDQQFTAIEINPKLWLVGDVQGRVYAAENRDQNWQLLSSLAKKTAINAIAFSPNFAIDQTIYIGTDNQGVLASTNNGKSFNSLSFMEQDNAPIRVKDIVTVAKDNSQMDLWASDWNQGVFYSEDQGQTWQKYSQGLTQDSQADQKNFQRPHFNDLAISPNFQQDHTLFLAGFDGLFKSKNRGQSWQEVDAFSRSIIGLVISPDYEHDSTIAVVTYVGEAYLSRDRGLTWQPMFKGLELPRFTNSFDQPEIEPRTFYHLVISPNYSENKSIFATILWGKFLKYSALNDSWKINALPESGRSLAIAVSPAFAQDKTIYLAAQQGTIFKSIDGGKSFIKISKIDKQPGNESPSLVISPNYFKDQTLFATSKQGVYQSTDAGKTWQVITDESLIKFTSELKLAISPNYQNDQTLLVSSSQGLFITKNGGNDWQKLKSDRFSSDAFLTGVAISPNYSEDHTFIVSIRGKGLFKTIDSGLTFNPIANPTISLAILNNFESSTIPIQFSPAYKRDQTIYGIGAAGATIYQSTDGGESWKSIDIPQAEIFKQYAQEKYDQVTSLKLYWYIYRRRIMVILAILISAIALIIISTKFAVFTLFLKILNN